MPWNQAKTDTESQNNFWDTIASCRKDPVTCRKTGANWAFVIPPNDQEFEGIWGGSVEFGWIQGNSIPKDPSTLNFYGAGTRWLQVWGLFVAERALSWLVSLEVVWALFERNLGLWSPWCCKNGQTVTLQTVTRKCPAESASSRLLSVRFFCPSSLGKQAFLSTLLTVLLQPRGLAKGWFSKRVVLTDVPPERKPERGFVRMFPRNEKPEQGDFRQKLPFYETTLLPPLEQS